MIREGRVARDEHDLYHLADDAKTSAKTTAAKHDGYSVEAGGGRGGGGNGGMANDIG